MRRKEKVGRQDGFFFMNPHLEHALTRGDLPQPAYAVTEFREHEGKTRVRTNISKIEKWLPFFYWKEGLIDKPESMGEYQEAAGVASIVGTELHGADVLFNLIVQGTVGPAVVRGIPSAKQEDVDLYGWATEKVSIGKNTDERKLFNVMVGSWKRLLDFRLVQEMDKANALPMFDDLGFSNPLLKFDILKSKELFEQGLLLAKDWAGRYFQEGNRQWGHGLKHQSINEVLTIVNTELLQIMGRLDRVTREEKTRKTVTVQVTDLKTGNREAKGELEKEIRLRQAQMALFMAERFTTHYVLDKRWLQYTGKGFALNTSVLDNAPMGRAKFFYRWLDKRSGKVEWEQVTMDINEREEFLEWLIWYSTRAQEHKVELKKLR
jgi:hypothetical protein